MRFKIGVVASLSGFRKNIGQGYLRSVEYVLERRKLDLRAIGFELDLVVKDDKGNSGISEKLAIEIVEEGCIALLCPDKIESTYKIIVSEHTKVMPLICSFASSSFLSRQGNVNFFHYTTPDSVRTEILVRYVRRTQVACVYLYVFSDSENSYSQQLCYDVISSLENHGIKWVRHEFDIDIDISQLPDKGLPAIVCAPSFYVASLARKMRSKGFRGQFFSFGSNSNLLTHDLNGTIVVCDLDREDRNPIVKDELDHFQKVYRDNCDPSFSTINAVHSILNLLINISEEIVGMDIPQIRNVMINHLRSDALNGLLGPISFTSIGQMAGKEQISILKVIKTFRGMRFKLAEHKEKEVLYKGTRQKKKVILTLSILGSIASILSLALWFFSKS